MDFRPSNAWKLCSIISLANYRSQNLPTDSFKEPIFNWFKDSKKRNAKEKRLQLLHTMLTDDRFSEHWRNLSTMAKVIGANEETTKELLIEEGARGSESVNDNLWGLIKYHPLNQIDK